MNNENFYLNNYNTKLSEEEYSKFLYDLVNQTYPINPLDARNYDIQGAWKGLSNNNVQFDERNHLTDYFKKPNHITDSIGSKYYIEDLNRVLGGHWTDTSYYPGLDNQHSTEELRRYMEKYEPNSGFYDLRDLDFMNNFNPYLRKEMRNAYERLFPSNAPNDLDIIRDEIKRLEFEDKLINIDT